MRETWRQIAGYSYYEVSDAGRVRSLDRPSNPNRIKPGRILKATPDTTGGYLRVTLHSDSGQQKIVHVHRLVLDAFHGQRPGGLEACHNNGVRTDNRASNLRWDTRQENSRDVDRHGTRRSLRGEECSWAKLSAEDIPRIFALHRSGLSQQKIADQFGVAQTMIGNVLRGVSWKHVPRSILIEENPDTWVKPLDYNELGALW